MAVTFSGDVHYMASDGTYQTIDNTLVYNEAKGQYRSAGNPDFAVTFAANASSPAVLLNDGKGNLLASAAKETGDGAVQGVIVLSLAIPALAATLILRRKRKI